MAPWRRWLMPMGGLVLWMGCAGQNPPPEWVSHVPGAKQELCAIGISGPTYYHEDATAASKSLAMTELARALEVKVTSAMTVQSQGDSRGANTAMQETAEFTSETVLKQSQVREQWVADGQDSRYGVAGTVYTLVCMPLPR